MERKTRVTKEAPKRTEARAIVEAFREAHRFTSQFRIVARLEDLLEPALEAYEAIGAGEKRLEEINIEVQAAETILLEMQAKVQAEQKKVQEKLSQIKLEYEANIASLNNAIAAAQKELDGKEAYLDKLLSDAQAQAQEILQAAQAEASGAKAIVVEAAKKADQEEKRYQNALASIGRLKERL